MESLYEHIGLNDDDAEQIIKPNLSYSKDVLNRFKRNKIAMISIFVLIFIIIMSIIGPLMVNFEYQTTNVSKVAELLSNGNAKDLGPNAEHWFGLDTLGRDLWARVWIGTRYSLIIGFIAAFVQAIIGVFIGCISGYIGGVIDMIIMRTIDILASVPYLIYVIIIMMVLGSGLASIILALTITGWMSMARLVRGQILMLKNEDYILAAKSLDTKPINIMLKHLIPNCMGVIIVSLSMAIPSAIFSEAFLSFLGIGLSAPLTSLGQLISAGMKEMRSYPYQLIIPSIVISLLMLSLQLIGDGLRDAIDPKFRK